MATDKLFSSLTKVISSIVNIIIDSHLLTIIMRIEKVSHDKNDSFMCNYYPGKQDIRGHLTLLEIFPILLCLNNINIFAASRSLT